jgi:hypothetical protein
MSLQPTLMIITQFLNQKLVQMLFRGGSLPTKGKKKRVTIEKGKEEEGGRA